MSQSLELGQCYSKLKWQSVLKNCLLIQNQHLDFSSCSFSGYIHNHTQPFICEVPHNHTVSIRINKLHWVSELQPKILHTDMLQFYVVVPATLHLCLTLVLSESLGMNSECGRIYIFNLSLLLISGHVLGYSKWSTWPDLHPPNMLM